MLNVVTFLWSTLGYRSKYTPEHVRSLARQVARHYDKPHRFICYTDHTPEHDGLVEWLPIWDDHANVPNPTWPDRGPSCYRRLKLFNMYYTQPFVMLDLDLVIVGDLTALWDRPEPCVTYRPPGLHGGVNGAMLLCNEPQRFRFVWDLFDPATSPATTQALGHRGSDQAWFTACLLHCSGSWLRSHGLYEYKDLRRHRKVVHLPNDARIVFFHGKPDPWECNDQWILDNTK